MFSKKWQFNKEELKKYIQVPIGMKKWWLYVFDIGSKKIGDHFTYISVG